jgi:ABC-type sugar transport system ATPase subunit
MLEVHQLKVLIGKTLALNDVSIKVPQGELLVVLGPNGSGKSTLLRLIVGLLAPLAGSISWKGTVLSSARRIIVPPEKRNMGLLFQEGVLFPSLDVRANVALGLSEKSPASESRKLVRQALTMLGITHLEKRSVAELSGGEQQRVALARLIAQRPDVMLLDEPFHSLDQVDKRDLIDEMRNLVRTEGTTALFVTHDVVEAAALGDRVLIIDKGLSVQEGSFHQVYRHPADESVARFMGVVQSVSMDWALKHGIGLPEKFHGSKIFFRPEDLILESDAPDNGPLEVSSIRVTGVNTEVTIAFPDGKSLLSLVATGTIFVSPGQKVGARIVRHLNANF